MPNAPELLTWNETCALLGVSRNVLRRWVRDGELTATAGVDHYWGVRRVDAEDLVRRGLRLQAGRVDAEEVLAGLAPGCLIRAQEAAQQLGVSLNTVFAWARAGRLTMWTTPRGRRRLLRSEVESLVRQRKSG